jgi:prepilin-type N-terminal cleavage/methylation domain-containing protein
MAIFGKWGYKRLGGKKGLTLIELLIVLVILAILAGVIVLAVGGIFGRTGEQAYNLVRDELQLAVTSYMTNISAGDPVMANVSNVDVCLLLGSEGGLLREVPDGVTSANGNCSGTDDTANYVWTFDEGNVGSVCLGADCVTPCPDDDYCGVWP